MTAKEYMLQPKKLQEEIVELHEELQGYMDRRTFRSSVLTDMPHNPNRGRSMVEEYTVKCMDIERIIYDKTERLNEIEADILETIGKVSNDKHRRVLKLIYIRNLKISEVASEMDFHQDYVKTLHRNALADIEKIIAEKK